MTAQRLRDAARGMREKAEGATPGPWEAGERCVWGTQRNGVFLGQAVVFDSDEGEGGCGSPADADYIAAMHPAVALAVADWLEREAESHVHVRGDVEPTFTYDLPGMDRSPALVVADAFLGQTEGAT